jgi:hypothetical protein
MEPFKFKKLGAIPYQRTGREVRVDSDGAADPLTTPFEDTAFFSQPLLMQGRSPECGGYGYIVSPGSFTRATSCRIIESFA